ncbi:MAG TPA: hypothetical protein VL595_14700 [Pseudonocardia sp.]|nr:hypothetical protein [Pseudonocardia sp.]
MRPRRPDKIPEGILIPETTMSLNPFVTTSSIVKRVARAAAGVTAAGVLAGLAVAPAAASGPAAPGIEPAVVPVANVSYLASGPDTCRTPFVWREARPSDHVCVTVAERTTVARENATPTANRQPGGGASGPATCRSGFVWREAFDGDTACVTPARRTQAKFDNSQALARVASGIPYGPSPKPKPKTCVGDDGIALSGTKMGGSPARFKFANSPYLGARWDTCQHAVVLHFGGMKSADAYNIRINGKQREVGGGGGDRVFSISDSDKDMPEGIAGITVQACNKGGFLSSSSCTAWSPEVRVAVNMGSVTQY